MKSLWNSFCIAFAMFSRIPVPRADWSGKNMRYMMCFFPWIGIPIGVLTWLVYEAGQYLQLNAGFISTGFWTQPTRCLRGRREAAGLRS